ncbi:MAG: DNA mismatch endonuclease Vsr [Verrucomicrobia bacterium]|nr:DNA mismatch endonuclease Vsr [Verrucomicrobiota bacterium]
MADSLSRPQRSAAMAAVRSHGNKSTELALIRLMKVFGITGWRRGSQLFGKPDFVFPKAKLTVFVDGCFWHGCPRCGTSPRSNAAYWREKILRNLKRDRLVTRQLREAGWRVLRIWECRLRPAWHARTASRLTKWLPPSDTSAS